MKNNEARPPIARGDHVYIRHPTKGVAAVRVLATGKDGLTGKCDAGRRHGVPWDDVLGVRKRMDVLAPRERPEAPVIAKAAPPAPAAEPPKPPPLPPTIAERRMQAMDRRARAAEWERWSKRPPAPPPPPPPPTPRSIEKSGREPLQHADDAGPLGYFDFRDRMATDLRAGIVHPEAGAMIAHAADRANAGEALAAEWTERFLADADRHLERRRR